MFNKNIFTQKDPIAEAIAQIAEADYKAKMEELKGQQHKIDKNKNNKIDAHDFAILRGEKKAVKEEEQVEEGWDDMLKAVKAKQGPQPSGGSGVKQGSRYGGSKQKEKPEHDDEDKKKVKEEVDLNDYSLEEIEEFMQTEEYEQLDEVSKATLTSYMSKNKAHQDKLSKDFYAGDRSKQRAHKMAQRGKGYLNAGVKLQKKANAEYHAAKEKSGANVGPKPKPETPEQRYKRENPNSARPYWGEDVEQVDERTLTKGETAEKERIVKGMKKSLAGFKERYGERAKSVMYATATKAAKKD